MLRPMNGVRKLAAIGAAIGTMTGAAALLAPAAPLWAAGPPDREAGAAAAQPTSPGGRPATARPRAGDKAPGFSLKAIDTGETRTLDQALADGKPRGVLVVFLSCKCPYAAQARQPLGDLFRKYGAQVKFVGINANQNESSDDIKADAALSFPFPMLRDEGSGVADQYGAERTPEAFLIDASGVIRYHGGVADLGAALGELTAGKTVAKPEAKAFGCTIKRKSS
ncbi:MAG TPA: redoxin domain-containing protein [Polyangia bacterium]